MKKPKEDLVLKAISDFKDKVYMVISVQGCFPFINIERGKNGAVLYFKSEEKAKVWAHKNCSWQWKVIEW
jgi:hypothetical protein